MLEETVAQQPVGLAEPDATAVQEPAVRLALTRVLGSKPFAGSPRLSQFLAYTVQHTLAGEFSDLKESCIGVAVFGKSATYDPKEEPIVRVEARRLRARLDEYYDTLGQADSVRIHLPKGGYQASFELRTLAAAAAATSQPEVSVAPAPPESTPEGLAAREPNLARPAVSRPRSAIGFGLLLLVLAASIAAWFAYHRPRPLRFAHVAPLTAYPGNQLHPAISHDGKQLAFVWNGEDGQNYDIYVKLIDIGSPVRLTTDASLDLAPQWSPDDRFISFLRITENGISVYTVPALGGTEHKLADLNGPSPWKSDVLQVLVGAGAAWSSDGTELIVSDQETASPGTSSLYALPLNGSGRRRITHPSNQTRDLNAIFDHAGKHIAFIRETSNSSGDIFLCDPDGANVRQVTFDRMRVRGLAWSPDDRTLVFASNRAGADELWQVPARGGTPESFAAKGNTISYPTLSADGAILAYTSTAENTNIWRIPLNASRSLRAEPLLSSTGRNNSAHYSPDGRHIAFISDRSGSWELWSSDADGHDLHQLTTFGGPMVGTPFWSPDSRSIVFDARPNGRSSIYIVGLDGAPPRAVVADNFENKKPSWSRDGKSLYYTSNRLGISQLWKTNLNGTQRRLLCTLPANDNAESADGRFVYFKSEGDGLYRVPSSGGTAESIADLRGLDSSRYFAVDQQIFFAKLEASEWVIQRYDVDSRAVSTVASLPGQLVYGTPSLSISPDRRFALVAQQDRSTSEIMALRR
jgi:Tol biopolymer transport system component